MPLEVEMLTKAATIARGLAMDAVSAAQSGHLGLPLGCAEIGAVLFGRALRHCPEQPNWLDRDRFVLSAGHGSMFLYAWLHLCGYEEMTLEELRRFRQLRSKTPGHPETGHTGSGVETTTGPLGQGVANAVGMAISAKMAEARFNTPEHPIFTHRVVCLAGDGCMQEGVALEAIALAGHQKLDNLILIYDSNRVTLDAMAEKSQSEDTYARFAAIGFEVRPLDGHDLVAFDTAFEQARRSTSGKPQLIIAHTTIGKGIPEVEGTQRAHGEAGKEFVDSARRRLGLPAEKFYVSSEVADFFRARRVEQRREYEQWNQRFEQWQRSNTMLADVLAKGRGYYYVPDDNSPKHSAEASDLFESVKAFDAKRPIATRKAGQVVLQPMAERVPLLVGGSADLYSSTLNYIGNLESRDDDFSPEHRAGRNISFGIREHAMCAALNGISAHGIFRASGATFLAFSDYCRGAIRLAAVSGLPVIYIFTHDSVGVGEDGPTHEPVETLPALRVIPNLDVIRPADPEETVGAFAAAVERIDGPTLIALTRQSVPVLSDIAVAERREGVLRGGYVAKRESEPLRCILMSAGSELQHALKAAETLGPSIRVVSLPSFFRFNRQSPAYRDSVLPLACRCRVAIEATCSATWAPYVGLDGMTIGIDRFGLSAPGAEVMRELGMTAEHVIDVARRLLA
ncbi:MAG TPA: transketolase [Polyangiaceae bacterium]